MKTRTQKIISLVLVLVMLVSMVPMGIFSVSAEASAELAAGLADYANTTEFVINSVEDWEAISAIPAENKYSFGGKTVKLGQDIDFGGATVNPLFAYNFYGTFDGQGYTLKNANVVSETGNAGFVFRQLDGGLVTDLVIENVTVTNTSAELTTRTGILSGYCSTWADLSVTKVTIKNSTVKSTAGSAGLLIGTHYNNGQVDSFTKIYLDGTLIAQACAISDKNTQTFGVGGVVGEVNVKASATTWSNIESHVNVITNKTTTAVNLGGFAGAYVAKAGRSANISNVYVGGSITDENVSSAQHGCFVGQFQGTAGQDIAGINNIVLAIDASSMTGNSLTLANVWNGNLVYTNVYSVNKSNNGTWASGKFRWTGMSNNGDSYFNGTASPWTSADPIQASLTYVTKLQAYTMITRDADGFISGINANPTLSGLAADLTAYTATEYIIDSVEDWNLVSASGQDFSGKTVKLGADIDFDGYKAPALFTAGSFYGTFDGQGNTIKNATVLEITNAGLFTKKIGGGKVTNVDVDNVTVYAYAGYAGLVAGFSSVYANLEISKINATNVTVTGSGTGVGGVIGQLANKGYAAELKQINIQGAVTHTGASGLAGGFFADASFTAVGTTKMYQIKSEMDVTAPATVQAGAFGSQYTMVADTVADFDDIYVGGSVVDNYANTAFTAGFVSKFIGVAGADIATMDNIVLAADMTGAVGSAVTLAGLQNGNLVYDNVFSINKSNGGVHNTTSTRWTCMSVNNTSFFNGTECAWTSADPVQNSMAYVTAAKAAKLVKLDAEGFVDSIYDHIDAEAVQYSAVSGGKYAVRFIALSQLTEATDVNMVVVATYTDGMGTHKVKFDSAKSDDGACNLYDGLTVYSDYGIAERTVSASSYGAEKLAGFTIYDIPTACGAISFEVTTSYVDAYGRTVNGTNTMTVNFDANGALIK